MWGDSYRPRKGWTVGLWAEVGSFVPFITAPCYVLRGNQRQLSYTWVTHLFTERKLTDHLLRARPCGRQRDTVTNKTD